jgi:hypothetical protein
MRTSNFVWIVCRRQPGQGYQPMNFATLQDASAAAEALAAVICPPADVNQTYYFNTQGFG